MENYAEKKTPLSQNQEALWQAVRSRTAKGEPATVAIIRDDLKAQGMNVSNFARLKGGLIEKGLLKEEGGNLVPVVQPE